MPLTEADIIAFVSNSNNIFFASPPPEYLDCSICQTTLNDPVMCDSGAHTFCRRCCVTWLQGSAQCPVDRQVLRAATLKRAPQVVRDVLDALPVKCALGCGWTGTSGAWPNHLRSDCEEVEEEWERRRGGCTGTPRHHGITPTDSTSTTSASVRQGTGGEDVPTGTRVLEGPVNWGATCDLCHESIWDARYNCLDCPDFDLCQLCWESGPNNLHSALHGYVRFTRPQDYPRSSLVPSPASVPTLAGVHVGFGCDGTGCSAHTIRGVRFKCTECHDVDFCQDCVNAGKLSSRVPEHTHSHEMLRIVRPRASA